MTLTPVRDSWGEIAHFVAIKQDLTQRKRAEAALREGEERFRLLQSLVLDWPGARQDSAIRNRSVRKRC